MWRVFGYSTNVSTRRLKYLDLDDLRPNLPLLDVQNLHSADPTLTNNVFEQMQIMQGVTRQDELYRTDGENRWHKVSRWSIGNLFSLSAGVWAFRFACFFGRARIGVEVGGDTAKWLPKKCHDCEFRFARLRFEVVVWRIICGGGGVYDLCP